MQSQNVSETTDQWLQALIAIRNSRYVAKMFYQDGFPLAMSIEYMMENKIPFHIKVIINTLRSNGWSDKTIYNKLHGEMPKEIEWKNYLKQD